MKRLLCIILSAFSVIVSNGQDRLQELLDRYDYKTAIYVIDSLAAEIGADSTYIAEHREEVIDLALQKARCLRRLYRMQESVEVLAEVLYLDQFNIELMADLAESHMQVGNTMEAFTLYGTLSRMQPENPYFKTCQARILYKEKQYKESISICEDIAAQDSIPEILTLIADAYNNLGKADSALVYYNHILSKRPNHIPTMNKKADILLSAKQYQPVIEMSSEYLKEDPDNMAMLPIYGLALYLNGSYPLSIEQFEHQRDLGDDSYAVHYYLGLNHYMMDNWPRAIEELEKAYQIDSSDVTLVYQLAHAKSHMPIMTGMESHRLNPESEKLYSKSFQISFNNTHPSPSSPDTFPVIVHLSFVHAHMHAMPMHKTILLNIFIYYSSMNFSCFT